MIYLFNLTAFAQIFSIIYPLLRFSMGFKFNNSQNLSL